MYIKAMRMLLKRLQLEVDGEQNETIDVCIEGAPGGGKSNMMANVIKYCVSTQPVSMHIPLCRLLAGKTYINNYQPITKRILKDCVVISMPK